MLSSLMIPSFVRIYPIPVSYELVFTFFLFLYTICLRVNKEVKVPFRYMEKWIVFFFIYYIFIRILFSFLCGYFKSSDILVLSYINVLFLSTMFFSVWFITEKDSFERAGHYISIALLVICIYGISTYILQSNPYLLLLSKFTGSSKDYVDIAAQYANEVRGGLTSRISVLTYNPLQYAILLNAFIFVPLYMFVKNKGKKYLVTIIFIVINLFLTGSRGPLIAIIASTVFYFIKYQTFTSKVKYILLFICGFALILLLPGFEKYATFIKSVIFIFDQSASDAAEISGSSVSGRFLQLSGVLEILKSIDLRVLLFGYGAGYTEYYLSEYGFGTDVMGFESVLFSSLVNYGIVGFLLVDVVPWLFCAYCVHYLRENDKVSKKNTYILSSMLLTNVVYSFLVGSVYYILYFSIFFCLMKQMVMEKREKQLESLLMLLRKK